MASRPTVSVVIPTRNRASRVEAAVRAVLADPATSEVVVVDDGSEDETAEVIDALMADDDRVRRIGSGGVGSARARRAGVEASSCDVVLLIDDDVVAGPHLVTGHRDRHADEDDPDLVVVGFMPTRVPEVRRPGRFATYFYAAEYERRVRTWERGGDVLDNLWLGNVSAWRDALVRVGMADPSFPAVNHEDQDLGLRMRAAGMRAVFDRALHAEHDHLRTLDQFLRDAHRQGEGRRLMADNHGPGNLLGSALAEDLPLPLRWTVVATDRRSVRIPMMLVLRAIIEVAGRARLWPVEDAAAQLARRIELRRGAVAR